MKLTLILLFVVVMSYMSVEAAPPKYQESTIPIHELITPTPFPRQHHAAAQKAPGSRRVKRSEYFHR